MAKLKKVKSAPKPAPQPWRAISDALHRSFKVLPSPLSLHPDNRLIEAFADGKPIAREIIEAWNPLNGYAHLIRVVQV